MKNELSLLIAFIQNEYTLFRFNCHTTFYILSSDCHLLPAVNMAMGKAATQSSMFRQSTADKAVDGDTNTNYQSGSCSHTDGFLEV